MLYRAERGAFIVYSVGRDGEDHGGTREDESTDIVADFRK
jgi:hypothetical protein